MWPSGARLLPVTCILYPLIYVRPDILIVLGSVGIGAQPDAARYGDAGRDILGHIAECRGPSVPDLVRLGPSYVAPAATLPSTWTCFH